MSEGLVVLVCGGRDFDDARTVCNALAKLHAKHGVSIVIHGGCRGVDTVAGVWAEGQGINVAKVPALWRRHGKAAGPMRNAMMLRLRPDVVVAFPGGRGTANMVHLAREAGVRVWEPANKLDGAA